MATTVHSDNVLIEFSRTPNLDGWVKELIYQTINTNGELSDRSINSIFDILVNDYNASTNEPTITTPLELKLLNVKHVSGVNALEQNVEIRLCEEGITLLFGNNGSGKSGYFRVLNHICGGIMQEDVLGNVFESSPLPQEVDFSYQEGSHSNTCQWTNQPVQRGLVPFNRIGLFNSKYADLLVQSHTPDTYILRAVGYFQILYFRKNMEHLKMKIASKGPSHMSKFEGVESLLPNIEVVYNNYLTALENKLQEVIIELIGRTLNIHLEKNINEEGIPFLIIKLNKPYEIRKVLSEGERKTIALALFIAEQELKPIKDPIVMDDPVNSLDNVIIDNLANKLTTLENQVIIFTHNFIFVETLMGNTKIKKYPTNSSYAVRARSDKKHLIAYKIYSKGNKYGIVVDFDKENAKYHLDCVNDELKATPFRDNNALNAAFHLRLAIEKLVDEKIFLGLTPCRYRGTRGNTIPWTTFPNLHNVPQTTINTLKDSYTMLSGHGAHWGEGAAEVPLDWNMLDTIYNSLLAL